jgi:MFS family permease
LPTGQAIICGGADNCGAAGGKKIAVAGVAFAVVGYQLAAAHLNSGIWTLISYLTLGFVGLTLLNVSLINLITFSVSRQRLGVATGLNTVFRNLGSATAPTVAGTIFANYSTYVTSTHPTAPYISRPPPEAPMLT